MESVLLQLLADDKVGRRTDEREHTPRLPAKANGMRSRELLKPPRAAMLTMMGIIRATVPVLLTKAPIVEVVSMTSRKAFVSLPFAMPIMRSPAARARPVCRIAPPTTKSPAIMMTTEEEKPDKASVGVRMPDRMSTTRADKATISLLTRPQMNRAMVSTSTMRVIVISAKIRLSDRIPKNIVILFRGITNVLNFVGLLTVLHEYEESF